MCVQFLEGMPSKIWEGQKNVQISARYLTTLTLIANISGTDYQTSEIKLV